MMNQIILASGSPRRKNMLKNEGIPVNIVIPEVEEFFPENLSKEEVAMYLALKKALAVESQCEKGIIIAADTIVYKDEIIGKPRDYKEAVYILNKLRGTEHQVVTGVAILKKETSERRIFFETTKVYFKNYDDDTIEKYIQTGELWDKAGAYAIQGQGSQFIERIEGDYDNVVGLPLQKLKSEMKKEFNLSI